LIVLKDKTGVLGPGLQALALNVESLVLIWLRFLSLNKALVVAFSFPKSKVTSRCFPC